jgi:hypothetical protein
MRNVLICMSMALVLFVTLSSSESLAGGRKARRLAQGSWGGAHIRMEVGKESATIEYDCAHGEINGPLVIDRRGRFSLKGTHSPEHPGPIRSDETGLSEPANYSGWTDGKRMTLTVTLARRKQTVGTFDLTLGGGGRVFKCK